MHASDDNVAESKSMSGIECKLDEAYLVTYLAAGNPHHPGSKVLEGARSTKAEKGLRGCKDPPLKREWQGSENIHP